jgi:hypothetical protein
MPPERHDPRQHWKHGEPDFDHAARSSADATTRPSRFLMAHCRRKRADLFLVVGHDNLDRISMQVEFCSAQRNTLKASRASSNVKEPVFAIGIRPPGSATD